MGSPDHVERYALPTIVKQCLLVLVRDDDAITGFTLIML